MRRERARRCAKRSGRTSAGVLVAMATLVACGGGDGTSGARDAAVYAAVIRSLAPGDAGTMPKVVYVELVGGAKLTLEDQASVINSFDAPTTVRFVDERAEAVDDVPQPHVRREGVLLSLASTTESEGNVSVKATRYVTAGDERTVCVDLTGQGRSWAVASARPC